MLIIIFILIKKKKTKKKEKIQLLYDDANNLTDEEEANKVYLKIIDELKLVTLRDFEQYNEAVHNLNKAEFYLNRSYPMIHDRLIKQLSEIQKDKIKQKKERRERRKNNGNVNGNGNVLNNFTQGINILANQGNNLLADPNNYDFTADVMEEIRFEEQNFFNTARPLITDKQNVHDSSVNTKLVQDYKIIKDHNLEFNHDEFYEDMGRFSNRNKVYQIIETANKIKERNGTVGNINDTEFNVMINCYLKMKEIGGDVSILFDNIYNCSSEYFVCPTGVVANLISSFAFLLDNVGVMKTTQIIRSEIFQKVSIIEDPTKKQIENIVLEYKNDLSEHDFKRVLDECYIGAGLE